MARNVYAWPPVDAIGTMWTVRQPVSRSQSFFTGADISSSAERKRHVAHIEVPCIGDLGGTMNGGYCEILKDLLEGGKNLVRLKSMPVNWYFDKINKPYWDGSKPLDWVRNNTDVDWVNNSGETIWYSGGHYPGVIGASSGWNTVSLTNLPPETLIARPGEYVIGYGNGATSEAKVLRPAYSDTSGDCTIYLMSALTVSDHVQINAETSAVFMIDGELPNSIQPHDGNWSYPWNFRETFADEVGGFVEIDPWI